VSRAARLRDRLTDGGYAAGWWAVRLLPEPVARAAFAAGGAAAARRGGPGVEQLRANLDVVTGGRLDDAALADLTRRGLQSYARYWQEAFRLPGLSTERVVTGSVLVGREHLEEAHAQGRGMILALPHSGNWDTAGVWLMHYLDGPFLTVAERLRPESLYRRFVAYRERLGMRVVPLTGGRAPPCCGSGSTPAGRRACSSTATSPAPASRWTSSAGPPRCPAAPRCWPPRPGPCCCRR
jgi:lauroyl/myristoyl acyltransferase